MLRREQLADVLRIDELAVKASGEIATAAILAARPKGIETIESAAEYALTNPTAVAKILQNELYFEWISTAFTEIRKKLTEIDFKKIGTYDAASQSTEPIFEAVIKRIDSYHLNESTSGVYACINKIFDADKTRNIYTAETLNQIKNIKLIADDISRSTWRITHPYYYLVGGRRSILGMIVAFVVAIPVWYFFGAHEHSIIAMPEQALISKDIQRLSEIFQAQNTSMIMKVVYFARFAWDLLLAVPSLFLVAAAALAFARRRLSFRGESLSRYEMLFGDIGKELQKIIPNPPKWPSVEVKMTGDINIAAGKNIQQTVKSMAIGSYNKVKGDYDADIDGFFKEVADIVVKSENQSAAEHYAAFVDSLKNDKKSIARTMWDGLVKALPAVGAIASAAGAIAKLLGPS